MSRIIAGLFGDIATAEAAVARLERSGVAPEHLCTFVVNSPGQHDAYPIGGDRDESPGARDTDKGGAKGAIVGGVAGAVAGMAALPLAGPLAVPVAAGVGAYTGSLVGALRGTDDGPVRQDEVLRTAGTMVAVNASLSDVAVETIARVLKESKAVEVEEAEGAWTNGMWADFDALRPPRRVDLPPQVPSAAARRPAP